MPKLSRWFVKSALICLVLGSLAGGLPLAWPGLAALGPLAWHLLAVGWATQLIFGVAFWMFPLVKPLRPARTARPGAEGGRAAAPQGGAGRRPPGAAQGRGDERLGWAAFWLFNMGLALRAVGEPAGSLWPAQPWSGLLPVSALLQVAAIAIFIIFTWPRIRAIG